MPIDASLCSVNCRCSTSGGQEERSSELVAELVRIPVDVIVTAGDPTIRVARQATNTIPIVMAASRDPVGNGLVPSLARPGGNITGLSQFSDRLAGKRLELLTMVGHTVTRVAALGSPTSLPELRAATVAAGELGVELQLVEVRVPDDVEEAIEAASREDVDALFILSSGATYASMPRIAEVAKLRHLPAIWDRREFAVAGGLMAYGPNIPNLWHRAAYYVDRILKGAKPADLPIEQPMTFDFIVNMKTARELGITFPPEIQLQITEVIQ
jgi:putative ABC transport system substrate-binding protein